MLPHELVTRFIIPSLRGLIALELLGRGLTQSKVAKLLGVSQPMISKYLSEGRESLLSKLTELGVSPEEADATARLLAETLTRGRVQDYLRVFSSYLNQVLISGTLCRKHREAFPNITPQCDICKRIFKQFEDQYVEEARSAYELLRTHPLAYKLVPEVGMNIVVAAPEAKSLSEVVGFAGRIVRVGRDVKAVGDPIYGGSRHTARVLLMVRGRWDSIRAAIVIKHFKECVGLLSDNPEDIAYVGPHEGPDTILRDIEEVLKGRVKPPKALVDLGGYGVESVIYVFGRSASEVVREAIKCANALTC